MISVVEQEREKRIMLEICSKSPFGCKISAIALAYGFDKRFSMFWLDDRHEAVYCLVDDTMIVAGTILDPLEALSFIKLSGAQTLICAIRNVEAMGLNPTVAGDILSKQLEAENQVQPVSEEAPIREIYGLLEEVGMVEDEFEAFYLDLSHRLRHNRARVVTKRIDGELVGCAVVSAVARSAAILSAVAVQEKYRAGGLGAELVRQAEQLLGDKMLYVYIEMERNLDFYKKFGFKKTDTWASVQLSLERGV